MAGMASKQKAAISVARKRAKNYSIGKAPVARVPGEGPWSCTVSASLRYRKSDGSQVEALTFAYDLLRIARGLKLTPKNAVAFGETLVFALNDLMVG